MPQEMTTQDRLMWGLGQAGSDWSWTSGMVTMMKAPSIKTTTADTGATGNTVAKGHDVSTNPGVNSSGDTDPSGPLDALDDLYDYYWETIR